HVTGVQTCALPISSRRPKNSSLSERMKCPLPSSCIELASSTSSHLCWTHSRHTNSVIASDCRKRLAKYPITSFTNSGLAVSSASRRTVSCTTKVLPQSSHRAFASEKLNCFFAMALLSFTLQPTEFGCNVIQLVHSQLDPLLRGRFDTVPVNEHLIDERSQRLDFLLRWLLLVCHRPPPGTVTAYLLLIVYVRIPPVTM